MTTDSPGNLGTSLNRNEVDCPVDPWRERVFRGTRRLGQGHLSFGRKHSDFSQNTERQSRLESDREKIFACPLHQRATPLFGEYGYLAADKTLRVFGTKPLGDFGQNRRALLFYRFGNLIFHFGGLGAGTSAVSENMDFGKPHRFGHFAGTTELRVGLSGKPDNDVGRERDARDHAAERKGTLNIGTTWPAAFHPCQNGVVAALHREMKVVTDPPRILNRHQGQFVGNLDRLETTEPITRLGNTFDQNAQKRREGMTPFGRRRPTLFKIFAQLLRRGVSIGGNQIESIMSQVNSRQTISRTAPGRFVTSRESLLGRLDR